jgi:diguanylate cyclase (GGDEF)-like protein
VILVLGGAVILILVWLVVKHVRDAHRMRIMALTDELTRLPNRRAVFASSEEQLTKSKESGEPFAIVAFDIDHFKRINDTWGHAAGDRVLQRVAQACRAALRPNDRIGRTGGEEFLVLLPGTRVQDALHVAERLRAAVEKTDNSDIDPSLRVTISLGVTEWSSADTTIEKIAGRADDVLYRAKAGGRNRVELAVA